MEEMINNVQYFPVFKFIRKDEETIIPEEIIDSLLPEQRDFR